MWRRYFLTLHLFSFLSPHLLICDLSDTSSLGTVCFKVISTLCVAVLQQQMWSWRQSRQGLSEADTIPPDSFPLSPPCVRGQESHCIYFVVFEMRNSQDSWSPQLPQRNPGLALTQNNWNPRGLDWNNLQRECNTPNSFQLVLVPIYLSFLAGRARVRGKWDRWRVEFDWITCQDFRNPHKRTSQLNLASL